MGEHTQFFISVSTLLTYAAVGYVLGRLRRERDARAAERAQRAAYIRMLQEHDRRINANSALIDAITDDLDAPPERERARRHCRSLPEGWRVYSR